MKVYEKFLLIKTAVLAAQRLPEFRQDFIKALRSEARELPKGSEMEIAFTQAASDIEAMDANPVDVLRPILQDIAERAGLELDEAALQKMREYCDQQSLSISPKPKR